MVKCQVSKRVQRKKKKRERLCQGNMICGRAFLVCEIWGKPCVDGGEEQRGVALARGVEHAVRKVDGFLR